MPLCVGSNPTTLNYTNILKLNKILEIKIIQANDNGKKIFQPNLINWSYLYLGKVTLTQTKLNKNNTSFNENQTIPGIIVKNQKLKRGNQPPKKKVVIKEHIKIIFVFSPKKNWAKVIAEYSTK